MSNQKKSQFTSYVYDFINLNLEQKRGVTTEMKHWKMKIYGTLKRKFKSAQKRIQRFKQVSQRYEYRYFIKR